MKKYTSKNLLLDRQTEEELSVLRSARYQMFKQTHDLSLLKLTIEEWLFLQRKADLYEQLTGVDRFDKIIELYKRSISTLDYLEKGISYQCFLTNINLYLQKDCGYTNKKLHTVEYFTSGMLEELLGEEAYYNGERYLIQNHYRKDLKEKLKKYLSEKGYYYLDERINYGLGLAEIAVQEGLSSERIRQKCIQALNGNFCKKGKCRKTRHLLDSLDVLSEPEIIELDTTLYKNEK